MRKFLLQNEYGEQINLQGGNIFLYAPEGLGFEENVDYMQSNGFFLPTSDAQGQVEKYGTLVFYGNGYKEYQDLMDWILAAKKLSLAYMPIDTWYYQNVSIKSVEKSELKLNGKVLEVPVVFSPLSPIYAPYDLNLTIEGQEAHSNKKYDYMYPYVYSNSGIAGKLNFTFSAQIDSDWQVELDGAISAPAITVTRNDTNEVIGKVDLTATSAQVGETIVFNTVAGRAGAKLIDGNGDETDLTPYLGLDTGLPTYFRIPANVPCSLQITATSLLGLRARMVIYRYYRTV